MQTMSSHVLPQALHFISRNPTCCPVNKLGFPTTRLSISRVSSRSFGFKFDSAVSVPKKPWFVPRAEVGSGENETSEVIEDVGDEASGEVLKLESDVKSDEEVKPPRKARTKLGDIMGILNSRAIEASEKVRPTPDIRTGDIVQIKLEVPENKRRLSTYKGIVMSKQNAGIHTTIRIRRIVAGIGVEIVFPVLLHRHCILNNVSDPGMKVPIKI